MTLSIQNFARLLPANATPDELTAFSAALTYLQQSPDAVAILNGIIRKNVSIIFQSPDAGTGNFYSPPKNNPLAEKKYQPNTIYWLPDDSGVFYDDPVAGTSIGVESAALAFVHEGAHALDAKLNFHFKDKSVQWGNGAEQYVIQNFEQPIAAILGEPI